MRKLVAVIGIGLGVTTFVSADDMLFPPDGEMPGDRRPPVDIPVIPERPDVPRVVPDIPNRPEIPRPPRPGRPEIPRIPFDEIS